MDETTIRNEMINDIFRLYQMRAYILFDNIDHEVVCVANSLDKLAKYYFEYIIASSYDLKSYVAEYDLAFPLSYEDNHITGKNAVIEAFENDVDVSENWSLFESIMFDG